jgi:hypothetical protein
MSRYLLILALVLDPATATPVLAGSEDDKALLQRIYQMRLRHDQERQQAENEARANVRLASQAGRPGADSPTVTQMRQQTSVQLARYEHRFRCLDVDVDSEGGNTVVICGDNSGDIEGSNTSAGRDLIQIDGAGP